MSALELDDDGRVLDPDRGPVDPVDLDDPLQTDALSPTPSAGPAARRLRALAHEHRRGVRLGAAGAAVLFLVGAWWAGRPPYDVPDLTELAPLVLTVADVAVDSPTGSPTASLTLRVRNDSPAPLTVATAHRPSAGVEVDRSPEVVVPPGGSAAVTTRLLVHDCSAVPRLASLGELPRPVPWAAASASGITLTARLGDEVTDVSLPVGPAVVEPALSAGACAGRPPVSAELSSVEGTRTDAGWQVVAGYAVRSTGLRVAVGREHFTATSAGSVLATSGRPAAGEVWWAAPAQLDGGAGRVPVTFAGASCDSLAGTPPPTLPVTVTMPDSTVYGFELPADDVRLAEAAYAACGLAPSTPLAALGWRMPVGDLG